MNDTAHEAQDRETGGFEELGLDANLITALERLKLDAPTGIQQQVIPAVLEGRDCLARASSGAGKTNAYLLPILQTVTSGEGLQVLVIQPTRSIAQQLERNMKRFAPERPVRTGVAAGGRRTRNEPDPLADDPDVLIATPRGVNELVRKGRCDWSKLRLFVIDETDAILDDRGLEPLQQIHAALPAEHQTIVIAGVLDQAVRTLAGELLRDPVEFDPPPTPPRAISASQGYFAVEPDEKFDVLVTFCKQKAPKLAIVFVNTEEQGRELARRLDRVRIVCRWIGERRPPGRRDRRSSRAPSEAIVAADPAPRRITTIPASHLLHYELPEDADGYMQRLEQVARLRRGGAVIAFVEPDQTALIESIAERIDKPIKKLETPQRPEGRREGRRGKPTSKSSSRPSESKPTPAPPTATDREDERGRLNKLLLRDTELEERGVRPPRRTLGSRFRPNRRGKPLRRPGPPK
jgi:superfamily II DNA/RNA helicase